MSKEKKRWKETSVTGMFNIWWRPKDYAIYDTNMGLVAVFPCNHSLANDEEMTLARIRVSSNAMDDNSYHRF